MSARRLLSVASSALVGLLILPASSHASIQGEAVVGEPFGVGSVTVSLTKADAQVVATKGYLLLEENGRAIYPVFSQGTLNRLLGSVTGGSASPTSITARFLFTGREPLKVSVVTSKVQEIEIRPAAVRPLAFNRTLRAWWREYHAMVRVQTSEGDYPPVIETYLTSMLGKRLGLAPPILTRLQEPSQDQLMQTLALVFGSEQLRFATMRNTMAGQGLGEAADQPVPAGIRWGPPLAPPAKAEADIEPIAMRVPANCFYVRFGEFNNFVWMNKLLQEYGGDISSMVRLRGNDNRSGQRMQDQLAMKQTKLGELFGGTVIADVALIGRDMFVREGAAIGVLFQAKSSLFEGDTRKNRKAIAAERADEGATLEKIEVAGREVTLLSTPDNSIRSFYAIDGKYHLVTTSRAMVEQFFATKDGKGSLGASAEFAHARTQLPTSRDDTIFVYFSSAFLRGLVSPQYQIELKRRLQAVTDIELLQLAQLAARNEGKPHHRVADLVAANVLPAGFGSRPDGSGPVIEKDGRILDLLRGARGSFKPIPDVTLHAVTSTEAREFAERAAYYAANWKQMDPLAVGVKRYSLDKKAGTERIVVDANVSPFGETKYGWIMSLLGPPTKERITTAPGDLINVQASVKGGLLLPSIPPHYLFVRVQDIAPKLSGTKPSGFFELLELVRTTPGYIGAWPKPGFLDLLPFNLGGSVPDPHGFSTLPLGIQRWQGAGFSTLSMDRGMLAHVAPSLRPEPTDDPAQLRINVGDLSKSKLVPWLNTMNYQRSYQTSLGNVRMLHTLSQQFQLPRDEALVTAEKLLDVKFKCALAGEYALAEADGVKLWHSNKWSEAADGRLPDGYEAPVMGWFRGVEAGLTKFGDRMMLHVELDMQRKKGEAIPLKLPSFNLFGPKKKAAEKPVDKDPPKPAPKKGETREF